MQVRTYYKFMKPGKNTYYTLEAVLLSLKPLLLQNCNGLKITVIQHWRFRALVQTLVLTPEK